MIWLLLLSMAGGVVIGYLACSFGTWHRVHKQESDIRWLVTEIEVLTDMGDEVPPEWIVSSLQAMVAKEFR